MTVTIEQRHDWKPNDTFSVWRCAFCGSWGFSPHPLPPGPCPARQDAG
jgi:hypothetical protein